VAKSCPQGGPPVPRPAFPLLGELTLNIKDLIKQNPALQPSIEEPTNLALSMDDLAAELSLPVESNKPSSNSLGTKPSRFLMQHFVLFSTPLFNVFLQGVLTIPASGFTLVDYLANAVVKANGHPFTKEAPSITAALLEETRIKRTRLFSAEGKEWHLDLVARINQHVKIDPTKCLQKQRALDSIAAYEEALATFLVDNGYDSPIAWIEAHGKQINLGIGALDLNQLGKDFIDF